MTHHHGVRNSKENRGRSKEFVSLFHYMNAQHRNNKVIYLELQYNYHYTYTYANIFNKVIYNINETKRISRTHKFAIQVQVYVGELQCQPRRNCYYKISCLYDRLVVQIQ